MSEKERMIEFYVGRSLRGDDCGDWFVVSVYVPADLPREEAIAIGEGMLFDELNQIGDQVVFTGLYHYWDDYDMEMLDG